MTTKQDLLIEIGTEELPPKSLLPLSKAFEMGFWQALTQANLDHAHIQSFATPRRLALCVTALASAQADQAVTRKGPSLKAAFDATGNPTQAALGFAKSCQCEVNQLSTLTIKAGKFLAYQQTVPGRQTHTLLPTICEKVLLNLPIPKRMRWGSGEMEFIRPVHWYVLLFGDHVIEAELFGCQAGRATYGHRFHHPQAINLQTPAEYADKLFDPGFVIADFSQRRNNNEKQIQQLAQSINATVVIDATLLDEVTGLNEWPVAFLAKFAQEFLNVPPEALISAMRTHQKAFHLIDAKQQILPYFIGISNIQSKNPFQVVHGNERVMHARLSDAAFFYHSDCQQRLESRLDALKAIIFQTKLGTLYDKTQRMVPLTKKIAVNIGANVNLAERASLLCKTDLVTAMVGEFPELQGVMGYYYAQHDTENKQVALAIRDHYKPCFAGDVLPENKLGCAVALADRLDTLIGIFGINQQPTGAKDPFGLRRAALGIVRLMIEMDLDLDLHDLLITAHSFYQQPLSNQNVIPQVQSFILERLNAYYQEQAISATTLMAVLASQDQDPRKQVVNLLDMHKRVLAVHDFCKLPEAAALAQANKRASNILTKNGRGIALENVSLDPKLFAIQAEHDLYDAIEAIPFSSNMDYASLLTQLAKLRQPLDQFFNDVLVMAEDENVRHNRLALLAKLRGLFLRVADIAKLNL